MTRDDMISVGKCPECGIVADACVQFRFPCPATCSRCGSELDEAQLVSADQIAEATADIQTSP